MSTLPGLEQTMTRHADLSGDGVYRYSLDRRWGSGLPLTFVMLNPSTADANVDDPTIRRCLGFARAWDFSALRVVNLYALRSTDPKALWNHPDPVGYRNGEALRFAVRNAGMVVAAWGAHARPQEVQFFRAIAGGARCTVHALKVTKSGAPGHPLYIPAAAEPFTYTFPPLQGATP
jgi:hypothetical protein